MLSIPPQVSMWLNIVMAAAGGIGGISPGVVAGSPAAQATVQVAGLTMVLLSALNGWLHATSSATPGPLGK